MPDMNEIKKIVVPIANSYGVKRLQLFGSYAKGTANEKSDVDLLVEKGKPMSLLKLSGMRQVVQEALNLSVDCHNDGHWGRLQEGNSRDGDTIV